MNFFQKVYKHPNWREGGVVYYDVAIIQLDKPFDFGANRHITSICLPEHKASSPHVRAGHSVTIQGYGQGKL